MRTLILATVSAIALGIAGAGPLYAQNMNNAPSTNPAPAAEQTPSAGTMQPASPQAGNAMQQTSPSMSGNNLSNNPGMASAAQSSTDWPRVSRNDIEQIQQKLKAEGLYRGRIDGLVGPETQHALRAFQRQHGLRMTATLDPQTLNSLMGNGGTGTGVGVGSSMPPNSANDMNMPPSSNAGANGGSNGSMPANQR